MDIEDIPPGVDFEKFIGEAVSKCDLLIAIIGPQWSDTRDENGRRRLELDDDFTRIEIESALTRDIRVIPVLVGGAKMPTLAELPSSLRPLAKRQNFELPDRAWDDGCRRLAQAVEQALTPQRAVEPGATADGNVIAEPSSDRGAGWLKAILVGAAALAVVAIGVTTGSWRHDALDTETPSPSDPQQVSLPAPAPQPAPAPLPQLDTMIYGLKLEGTWRLVDQAEVRIQIDRAGDSLRLVLITSRGRQDLGLLTPTSDSLRFDFQETKFGVLNAKPANAGNWTLGWDNPASFCRIAGGSLHASPDLRIWRAELKCSEGPNAIETIITSTASLTSDGTSFTITVGESRVPGQGPEESIIFRRESH